MSTTVTLVTGANRGLGLECVRQLVAAGHEIIATARRAADATATASQFPDARVTALELDVANRESMARAGEQLRSRGTRLNVLINNAGTSLDGFDAIVARRTTDVNFFGALDTTDALLPLLVPQARIVMVSSGLGTVSHVSPSLAQRFSAPNITREEVVALVRAFVASVEAGTHTQDGWPTSAYSVSKIALNAITRVLAREHPGMKINAVSPGWARTRMGGSGAPRSVEMGAKGIVWAATLPDDGPTGGFFEDGRPVPW